MTCKIFALLLALTGLAVPHASAQAQQTLNLAALISDTSNPYWKAFEEGLRDTAQSEGIGVSVYTLRTATDAEGQLNNCETALLRNPHAILFAAVNGINLASCLRKADRRGILLVDVDGNVDERLASRMGVNVAFSAASNNYDLGARAADYIKGRHGKVLIIEGISGSQPSDLRIRGFKENLSDGLQVVSSQPGDWDRIKGADISSRAVLKYPDLAFIFAANDTMALGAVEALRAERRTAVKVVGIDGSSDAIKAIRDGMLMVSIAQLPYLMAKEAIEKTARCLKESRKMPFHQYVPILAVDQNILNLNKEPLLKYLR